MLTRKQTSYQLEAGDDGRKLAGLADALASLAFDLEEGRLIPGDLATLTDLTLAADDLLGIAAALAPDPWPYIVARAAVGSLPSGADVTAPEPVAYGAEHVDAPNAPIA